MLRSRLIITLLLSAALAVLAGCSMSPDELYTPPKPPEEYQNLDARIKEVLATGAEYAAPLQGGYTQQVQLMDLDGDGVQEAIAFFRVPTDAQQMKIYIYRQVSDGDYQVQTVIQGDGTAINSIAYANLDDSPDRELVVSWQISNKVYQLMAYSLRGGEAVDLMQTSYTEFALTDLDKDNQQEIVVLGVTEGVGQADFYDYEDGRMVLKSSAPMSGDIVGLAESRSGNRVRADFLREAEPAVFATSTLQEGVITDIFALKNGVLTNITLDPVTEQSNGTFRYNGAISARDINGDSILELPRPTALPSPQRTGTADSFWSVQWVQYDLSGNAWPVFNTFYNTDDGWYFQLPESWTGKLAVSRSDNAASGERGVVFSYWDGDASRDPIPFLTIYKLTGPNRTARSQYPSRVVLRTESDTIYAAKLDDSGWDCGLTSEDLPELFALIQAD